ncbi:glycosyltransferase family 4 protein [Novipirellula sp. SH528]|uniref:glycosyltransferase family 4 protein n=1 Tax=Novipirellula sp. SH528 TaxID=3454466 RepID=UPI003FA151E4
METSDHAATRVCVVSFKQCWQDATGQWMSYGGFPLQMTAVGTLFDQMTLMIERGKEREGGLPLPKHADVIVIPSPVGVDARRKLSVLTRLPYYLWKIAKHCRNCDAVHTPVPGDMPLLGMIVAIALRKPLLARYGGSWASTGSTTTMNRVTRGIMTRFSGGRNVMLATGDESGSPGRDVQWIFSTALSDQELSQITPKRDDELATPARFVYIGRLSPEKGVAVLIRAIAKLRDRKLRSMPMATLIGDGPQRAELESLVSELDCGSFIRFAGQLDRGQLSKELMQADFCVQPSLTEGFSKAWLDAMAFGLPVLASNVGAASSVIGQNNERGWLTTAGDCDELTNRIVEIISEPNGWRELRVRCREYVENRTLEAWQRRLGELCARQWKMRLVDGRLRR